MFKSCIVAETFFNTIEKKKTAMERTYNRIFHVLCSLDPLKDLYGAQLVIYLKSLIPLLTFILRSKKIASNPIEPDYIKSHRSLLKSFDINNTNQYLL